MSTEPQPGGVRFSAGERRGGGAEARFPTVRAQRRLGRWFPAAWTLALLFICGSNWMAGHPGAKDRPASAKTDQPRQRLAKEVGGGAGC